MMAILSWIMIRKITAEKIKLKASVGVLFVEKHRSLLPIAGHKPLNVMIRLPNKEPLKVQRPKLDDCKPKTTNLYDQMCEEARKEVLLLVDTSVEVAEKVNEQIHLMVENLQTLKVSQKDKRAIVNLSNVFRQLFGTAQQSDIEEIYEDLDIINQNQILADTDRRQLFDAFYNFSQSQEDKFKNVFHLIDTTDTYVLQIMKNLTNTASKVNEMHDMIFNPNAYSKIF